VIEGFVIKQMAVHKHGYATVKRLKHVNKAFKEKHSLGVKAYLKGQSFHDRVRELGSAYSTPARLHKARQHLVERSKDDDHQATVREIIQELDDDFRKEFLAEYHDQVSSVCNGRKDFTEDEMKFMMECTRQYSCLMNIDG
jgi:hypothetical protein